jgi:hypothetical protein
MAELELSGGKTGRSQKCIARKYTIPAPQARYRNRNKEVRPKPDTLGYAFSSTAE